MTLARPSNGGSLANNYNSSAGFIGFVPKQSEVGQTFVVTVTAGANSSIFSVLTRKAHSDSSGVPVLMAGSPQYDMTGTFSEQYYLVHVPAGVSGPISIVVDTVLGDADLFVNPYSKGFFHRTRMGAPNADQPSVWNSQNIGMDSVTLLPSESQYIKTGGLYCVTVFGFVASEFTVRVSMASTVSTLVEQFSTSGVVSARGYQYFRFYDTNPAKDVVLNLKPLTGDCDLFVGCSLNPTGSDAGFPSKLTGHFNYSSQAYLEDTILVKASDVHSCSHQASRSSDASEGVAGIFYVAVYGYTDSVYSLSAIHAGGVITLVPGQPQSGTVFKKTGQLYRIRMGFEAQDLTVMLSPEYGDADLYVKMDGEASVTDYDYKSATIGTAVDTVLIPETAICTNCWISILLYGYQTSKYSLLATVADGSISVYNGIAQKGSVSATSEQFYTYLASADCSVNAVITVTSPTEPNVYLSRTVERPGPNTPDTVKYDTHGAVPAVVLPGVLAGDTVYIGVAGGGANATYTLRVNEIYSAESGRPPVLLTLKDGQPQSDSILSSAPSAWLYYQVAAPVGHETIQIRSISVIGNVDLYVVLCPYVSVSACSAADALPSTTHYTLTTEDLDRDQLTIRRNDVVESLYIIGVRSTSMNAAYQISAAFENSVLELQAGTAVLDHVELHGTDYFSFYFDQVETALSFILTPMSGDPDIYVSTTTTHPGPHNNTWHSFRYGSDVLDIDPKTDGAACLHCMYYVAVYGNTESAYSISVTLKDTMQQLVDGQPISGLVRTLGWSYYTFYLLSDQPRDLQVNLQSIYGNADLYVTMDSTIPSKTNFAYRSFNWGSSDVLNILHTDEQYVQGRINIGVYGSYTAAYRLTLTTAGETIVLPLNTAQRGFVMASGNTQYKVLPSQSGTSGAFALRFSVSPLSGHVSLYVTCAYSLLPVTSNTSLWWMTDVPNEGGSLDVLSIAAADQGCLRDSTFYATIHGDSSATYSILASLVRNDTMPLLMPNVASPGAVGLHQMDYYSLRPGANLFDDIKLSLTVLQGDVDLYVSASWQTRPQYSDGAVKSFKFSSTNVGGDEIVLKHELLQTLCKDRQYCYIVVAAYGAYASAEGPSRYSLLLTSQDATIQLANGVPRIASVDTGRLQYFRYTLTIANYDLVIAVTPLSGDPDMYVGVGIPHPSRQNYTWSQSMVGADTLTIQYTDMAKKCIPTAFKNCEIYIGVYGWKNSTFSILASLSEGFISPTVLLDQTPQSGAVAYGSYQYYKYFVSIPPPAAGSSKIPVSLKFTLTPESGDPDLFAIFANHTEPGQNHYDYKSSSYSSVTDSIEVSFGQPHYCFNCVVYLAVYGFSKSAYTIQATSTGVTALQADTAMGGRVEKDKWAYYSFYNTLEFAEMRLSLTTISGDADIYVTTRKASDASVSLPTKNNYKWRSLSTGADSVSITYEHRDFCFDCEYIIGIMGFRNSTFTLLVSDSAASVIKLVQNRPQTLSLTSTGAVQYFSTFFLSSASDITLSLTSLDTGYADMYAAVYNSSTYYSAGGGDIAYPTPGNPRSYQYTTTGTEDNLLRIPPRGEAGIIVIAVVALQPVRFSIVASSSNSHRAVLLLSGVPQNHFVEVGQNELFKFYPSEDEDLRVSVTARSGDPDLFISSVYDNPHCTSGGSYWETTCSNYTWSSRMYSTDQILLSRDYPCTALVSSTWVDDSCNVDDAFVPSSGRPIYIGVYGYAAAKFSILVAPVGATVHLLAGQPQLSTTSAGFVCERNPTSGACKNSNSKSVQVGYFAFHVALPSEHFSNSRRLSAPVSQEGRMLAMQTVSDLMLTVAPSCNASKIIRGANESIVSCPLGCDCNPLVMYVNSCPVSKCTLIQQKPSERLDQHMASAVVSASTGSTLFLNSASGKVFCNPVEVGEDCAYYVAVAVVPPPNSSPFGAPAQTATFSITARTPGDIQLVPCDAKALPDGIKLSSTDMISNSAHYYEVCGSTTDGSSEQSSSESLIVEVEQCYGSTTVLACADDNKCAAVLPSSSSWAYFADATKTCTHSFDKYGKTSCTAAVNSNSILSAQKATLRLPKRNGNYYLSTNGTDSMYVMTISNTVRNGARANPLLVPSGIQSTAGKVVTVTAVTGNTLTVTWHTAQVAIPGVASPIFAMNMRYRAHIIDVTAMSGVKGLSDRLSKAKLDSLCGLTYAADLLSEGGHKFMQILPFAPPASDLANSYQTHTFTKLTPGHTYNVIITASCDGNCLRVAYKSLSVRDAQSAFSSCGSSTDDCKTQSMVYTFTTQVTDAKADKTDSDGSSDGSSGGSSGSDGWLVTAGVVGLIILLGMIGVLGYTFRKAFLPQEYEVAMGDSMHGSSFDMESAAPPSGSFSSYLDRTKGLASSSQSMLAGAVSSVSSFVGSLGSKPAAGSEHGVTKSYGEISVNRGGSGSGSVGTSKGVFGRMLGSGSTGSYAKVEEDDEVTEITL